MGVGSRESGKTGPFWKLGTDDSQEGSAFYERSREMGLELEVKRRLIFFERKNSTIVGKM